MNKLSLSLCINADEQAQPGIGISIDGISLIDLLRIYEAPMAEREGSPSIAGNYSWLPHDLDISALLLHQRYAFEGTTEDKSALLECTCGTPDCWPFLARISIKHECVIWSDFEQPHRTGSKTLQAWDYAGFGPFVFWRKQYEVELSKIAGQTHI